MMASWKAFVSLGMSFLYNARYFKAEGRLKGNPGDDGYVGLVVPMNLHTNVNLQALHRNFIRQNVVSKRPM